MTSPLNWRNFGICSSLYQRLNASSRSLVMVAFTTNSTVAMANLLGTFPRRAPRGARILPLTGLGRHAKRYRLNQGAIHGRFGNHARALGAGRGRGGNVPARPPRLPPEPPPSGRAAHPPAPRPTG